MNTTPHLLLIAQAINAERASADAKVVDGKLTIEGKDASYWMRWDEQRDHISQWRSVPNGRIYVRVDGWGWRSRGGYSQPAKTFPVRKDGTMNYAEIASLLLMRLSHELHQADKRSVEEQNRPMVEELRKEIGYGLGWLSPCNMRVGYVQVEIKKSVTPEQLRAIKAILNA